MDRYRPSLLRYLLTFRLVGGCCLVLLYLLTATPLVLALTTLLAMADRSHHVAVQHTSGGVQVVLRHDCFNFPTHRHGIIARTLTLMAQRPTQEQPDHVIQFAAGPLSEQASALLLVPVTEPSASELFPQGELLPCPVPLTIVLGVHARPPPEKCGTLLNVRSTVLRI